MNLIKIKNINTKEFSEAWKIYEDSFSFNNRFSLYTLKKFLNLEYYNFFAVENNNIIVGVFSCFDLENFLFGGHLAIKRSLRNKGLGTKLLKYLISKFEKPIVFEVEKPQDEISIRRIHFYERSGFKLNKFEYIAPPLEKGKKPVRMFLMTYPKKLTKEEFIFVREKIHKKAYGLKEPLINS